MGVWSDIVKAVSSIETLVSAFLNSFQLKVFNGSSTLFWKDPWCGIRVRLKDLFPRLYALDIFQDCKVKGRWGLIDGVWGGNWSWRLAPRGRAIRHLNTLISLIGNYALDNSRDDSWSWNGDVSGIFKVKTLATSASLNRLPSQLNSISRGVSLPSPRCPFCDAEKEDIEHFLIKCAKVVPVWRKVWSWWGLATPTFFPSFSIKDVALGNVGSSRCAKTHKVLQGFFLCALWSIWKWQNKVVNVKQESIDGVKKEDIFPFVQRMAKDLISPDATRPFPIGAAGFLSLLRYFYSCGLVLVFVSRLVLCLRVCPLL
ncbi:RNA-directed DNA polymerase, eukaryota, reverse transcriptase zinc-binding domain protein [Tanacetum coccineum]